jgi:hypothetical protein
MVMSHPMNATSFHDMLALSTMSRRPKQQMSPGNQLRRR